MIGHLSDLEPHRDLLQPHFDNFAEASHGEITAEELFNKCQTGARQCWVAVEGEHLHAVALTEVTNGGVWLDFCNGVDRDKWAKNMVDRIIQFADGRRVKVFCRPGWSKWLKQEFGFKETHRFLEMGDG